MGKKRVLFGIIGAGLLLMLGLASSDSSTTPGPEKTQPGHLLALGDEAVFGELDRPKAVFDHDAHTKVLRGNKPLEDSQCETCHVMKKDETVVYQFPITGPKKPSEDAWMDAFHAACIGCHEKPAENIEKAGPVTCGECHIPEPPAGAPWEKPAFGYALHHTHNDALESKCELCHHSYDEKEKKLFYKKGEETSCKDCHGEKDVDNARSFRKVAHAQCLTCHMERTEAGKAAGPTTCSGCHEKRPVVPLTEIAKLPRLVQSQKDSMLIKAAESGRMKAVPFDHKTHEPLVHSCNECHHKTLKACSTCHTLEGSREGEGISLEEAYHNKDAKQSCVGCHRETTATSQCMSCHRFQPRELKEDACKVCHNGSWERPEPVKLKNLMAEYPQDWIPEKVEIDVLAKDYKPAWLPHRKIVLALNEIAEKSTLAETFHGQSLAVCTGCHHQATLNPGEKPPACKSCHTAMKVPEAKDRPSLIGAYHRQCMECHRDMKIDALGCEKCHPEKESGAQAKQ